MHPFKATTLLHYDHRIRILDYVVSWRYCNIQYGDQGQQLVVRQPFAEAHFLLTEAQAQILELKKTLGIILVNSNFTSSEMDSMRALGQCSQMLAQRLCQETFTCPGKIVTNKISLFLSLHPRFLPTPAHPLHHQQRFNSGTGWKSSISVSCQALPSVLCSLHYNMQLPFIYATINNSHSFPLNSCETPCVT